MKKCDAVQVGAKFNELIVIEEDYEREKEYLLSYPNCRHQKFYKCKCSCGNLTTVNVYALLNGRTKSCGHLKSENTKWKHTKDLSGQRFGNLLVLDVDKSKPTGVGKHTYWKCKCEICGNIKSKRSSDLLSGKTIDCGCMKSERISNGQIIDITGNRYGHLKVIGKDTSTRTGSGIHTHWICECNICGRYESVQSQMLLNYGKDRCKICAGISMGEKKIIDLLEEHNISYIHDKPYLDCRCPNTGGLPRFDFRINQHSDCDYMIEFDGEQHYKPVPMYDNALSFNARIKRDEFKNEWCKNNNIPIIRIPYTRLKKLCIDDLRLETTKYLVA